MGWTGLAELPLHRGHAPHWLFKRMVRLARILMEALIDEHGSQMVLRRLADPSWFQALSCVLGYDWHSSGTTTVTCAALKEAFSPEKHGIAIAGGKGRFSREAPREILEIAGKFGFSEDLAKRLLYASRMTAKVDNSAIQCGYPLYHHTIIICEDGCWAVIQQGMNLVDKTARRYHWLSNHVKSFVVEPHEAIVCDVVKSHVLDMTARESEDCRKASVDLVNDGPVRVRKYLNSILPRGQRTLCRWIGLEDGCGRVVKCLFMPRRINWEALKRAYEFKPRSYEELLGLRGVGPSTVRALALISELVFGEEPSWRDPVKFSFCVGGKDGVPFPIDKRVYDEIISFMEKAVERVNPGSEVTPLVVKRLRGLNEG